MADLSTLITRLLKRLPGRSNTELDGWITESTTQHGYASVADVPAKQENAILAYAEYLGLKAKAAETAENASVNIANKVSVNKSGASNNYNALFKEALAQYRREAVRAGLRPITGGSMTSSTAIRSDGR